MGHGCCSCCDEVPKLKARVAALEKLVAELLDRLGCNSQNSSKPPSSDGPDAPPRPSKESSGRKPGGQKGHPGHQRAVIPPEKVDRLLVIRPRVCPECGALLLGDDPQPLRHQVLDVVDFKMFVTEYEVHTFPCLVCKTLATGRLPEGVTLRSCYGPGLHATVALLTGLYRLSKRLAVQLLAELLGIPISVGALSKSERIVTAALEEPYEEAKLFDQKQPVKFADETSWKEGKARAKVWLWVLCTLNVTVYMIRASRATEAAKELLGEAMGILVTDRLGSYSWWPVQWRQVCWAHLKRHFKRFIDAGGDAARIGTALEAERQTLFKWWKRVRAGKLKRENMRQYAVPLKKRVKQLLREGAACSHAKTAGTCAEILKLEPALWTFLRVDGVDPTNNFSERSLRTAVIWRKLSFGTHSADGSRFVERVMTAGVTLRQQNRNVVQYLTEAVRAHFEGRSAPSLLPVDAQVTAAMA